MTENTKKRAVPIAEDYTPLVCNHNAYYRLISPISPEPGLPAEEYYMRLVIDYRATHDQYLTFGPLSAGQVDQLCHLLDNAYLHIQEQWESPYESHIAQGIPQEDEERDNENE